MDEDSNTSIKNEKINKTQIKFVLLSSTVFLFIALLAFLYWYFFLLDYESTDDAYVHGNLVSITPLVSGTITGCFIEDNAYVHQGQLLVQIDPTDYLLKLDYAKNELALAVRNIIKMDEEIALQKSVVNAKKAELERLEKFHMHREALVNTLAVSKEIFLQSKTDMEVGYAALKIAQHQLSSLLAARGNVPLSEHPLIKNAKDEIRKAFVALCRCEILAPAEGHIAKRKAQLGETAQENSLLLTILPSHQVWIEANFKETQLRNMRIGQKAQITLDLYGSSVIFEGKIKSIGMGTGSVFSLIPPQNATGNWIKIVQRVPVRIELNKEQLIQYPVRLGLSCKAEVETADVSGPFDLNQSDDSTLFPAYSRTIPMETLEKEMEAIIQANLDFNKP